MAIRLQSPFVRKSAPTNVPAAIQTAMTAQGMDTKTAYGPGSTLAPTQGYSQRPRAMDYPLSVNIAIQNRTQWGRTPFPVLKALIDAYDVARMCINKKIDDLRSMDLMFVPLDAYKGQDVGGAIDAARAALEFPDRELPYEEWVSKHLENALRYDAAPLYRRRDMSGQVIGLEVLDGPSIAPWIDAYGRRPRPPAPAYYQIIHGQVFNDFTSDDVSFSRFRPQTDSPYGLAPIESILLTANTDIRFQWHFLQMFTEGSVPAGFMEMPPDTKSPDQMAEWQDYWDAMILGDQAKLHQLLAVPNGMKIQSFAPREFDDKFPEYLMARTCAAFGVTPQDIGLIDDVNRANGETQVDIQFRTGTLPWVIWLQGILTRYVRYDLGLPIQVRLDTGRDKEDRLAEAQAWKIYIDSGMASMDEGRTELLGLPIDNERPMPRLYVDPKAGPIPLANILAIAGPIDPETGAPINGQPLVTAPYDGAEGILASKSPGGAQFKRAPINPDEPDFPELEHSIPGSDVIGTKPAAPVIGDPGVPAPAPDPTAPVAKEATAGFTASTGVTGHDLVGAVDEDEEIDADPPVDGLKIMKERASFDVFVKSRRKRGKWRDFEFTALEPLEAHRLNQAGRVDVRKATGDLVAAGLCMRAADTGRVLMLQRGWDPTGADPAAGMWEFPGGCVEDSETPLSAAWREWQEETGCLIPADTTVGDTWASSNGIYRGYIASIATEASLLIGTRGQVVNPDDPDGDIVEAIAWWDPQLLPGNPAIRAELSTDLGTVLEVLANYAHPDDPEVMPADVIKGAAGDPRWHAVPVRKVEEKLVVHAADDLQAALANLSSRDQLKALATAYVASRS